MKKVIVIHGYGGYPNKNWFPWLKSELEKDGVEVIIPQMPNTEAPQLAEWLPYLQDIVGKSYQDTYLVGHSLGCITILKYLESVEADSRLGGAILVAGFAEPIHLTELSNFFAAGLDPEKVKRAANEIVLINSDNDEHVPLWQGERLAEKVQAKLIVLNNAGHINEKAGFKELPIVVAELKRLFAKKR